MMVTRCLSLAAIFLGASISTAFVQNNEPMILRRIHSRRHMSSTTRSEDEAKATSTRRGPEMSKAIPFLSRPKELTGELAGDYGFDPLGFAQDREQLWQLREAEIKHARLAMLAAAGWPLSELFDRDIAEHFGVSSTLDAADRAPSMFNGGIEKISPVWWGFCLGLTASIDMYGVSRARSVDPDSGYKHLPGDLGFDPLGLYPSNDEGRKSMQLAEVKHGRLAMIAVTGFAIQEAATQVGVVDETPIFFRPITETMSHWMQ